MTFDFLKSLHRRNHLVVFRRSAALPCELLQSERRASNWQPITLGSDHVPSRVKESRSLGTSVINHHTCRQIVREREPSRTAVILSGDSWPTGSRAEILGQSPAHETSRVRSIPRRSGTAGSFEPSAAPAERRASRAFGVGHWIAVSGSSGHSQV
jgi:hypothetical protein